LGSGNQGRHAAARAAASGERDGAWYWDETVETAPCVLPALTVEDTMSAMKSLSDVVGRLA